MTGHLQRTGRTCLSRSQTSGSQGTLGSRNESVHIAVEGRFSVDADYCCSMLPFKTGGKHHTGGRDLSPWRRNGPDTLSLHQDVALQLGGGQATAHYMRFRFPKYRGFFLYSAPEIKLLSKTMKEQFKAAGRQTTWASPPSQGEMDKTQEHQHREELMPYFLSL